MLIAVLMEGHDWVDSTGRAYTIRRKAGNKVLVRPCKSNVLRSCASSKCALKFEQLTVTNSGRDGFIENCLQWWDNAVVKVETWSIRRDST